MSNRKITKAIITAAGYGTRFLPASKNVPKELIPLIDTPVLEYITQECVDAGITDIIIVTSYGKNAIEDYFDSSPELEQALLEKGKDELYQKVRNVYEKANFIFVRQNKNLPYGTASPLLAAKNLINKGESFALCFGDDVFENSDNNALKELIKTYRQNEWADGVIGSKLIDKEMIKNFSILHTHEEDGVKVFDNTIERPTEVKNKLNYTRTGRFIYDASIFDYFDLDIVNTNPRGEFELTDIENVYKKDHKIIVHDIQAEWYPSGKPIDVLRSTIKLALKRDDLKDEVVEFIKSLEI
jgi:UTP--glucose-1-phosphate uridylyltransferase